MMAQNYIRKIFSDSIVYSLGYFLNRLMPFLLMPVYTYYFLPKEYGTYTLLYQFWMFVVIFYLFGMETSFQKFFIEAKTEEDKRSIFSSTILMLLLSSVIFSIFIFFFSASIAMLLTGNAENAFMVKIIAVLLVIDSISRIPMILLVSMERSKLYTTINLIVMAINVSANIIFIYVFKSGIEAIFYANLISYSFLLIFSFAFSAKYFSFTFDIKILKVLLKFASSFLLYGLFVMCMDGADRFIIGYFKGKDQVGIYSACYRIGVIMNLLILGFRSAWTPFFLKLKENENNKEIFALIFSYFCYAGLFLFIILSFFIEDLIKLKISSVSLLDEKYWGGIIIIPYILLAYLFFGLFTNLSVASYFENKIKYLIISSAAGCISNILLNIILIPIFSIRGAAIATLLSYLIMFIVLYVFSQKTYYIPYDWINISKAALFAFLLMLTKIYVSGYLKMEYFSLILIKILAVFSFFLFLYMFKFIKLPHITAKK